VPEAGRTPAPAYERGNTLQYGEAGDANALMGLVAETPDPDPYAPSGDEEEFLYSQTDRPGEPLTAGAPVGAGSDFSRHALEDDDSFRERVAAQLSNSGVREARALADRLRKGL
jgi:hypothetical protein